MVDGTFDEERMGHFVPKRSPGGTAAIVRLKAAHDVVEPSEMPLAQQVVEEVNTSDSQQSGTENVLVKADMAYLEYPNGGAVFSTSSIAWSGSLSYNGYDNNVSRITENVVRRFASDEPIPWPALPATPGITGDGIAQP